MEVNSASRLTETKPAFKNLGH